MRARRGGADSEAHELGGVGTGRKFMRMGKRDVRYVAKADARKGWRIWDRKARKWWGEPYVQYPEQLLTKLNDEKRPHQLTELIRRTERKRT